MCWKANMFTEEFPASPTINNRYFGLMLIWQACEDVETDSFAINISVVHPPYFH